VALDRALDADPAYSMALLLRDLIVSSPLRISGRLASDIAHELSHLLLKHELSEIREISGVPFRTCRPEEEEQATNFGGTLLLPRPLLVSAARQGLGAEEIAEKYDVTGPGRGRGTGLRLR
jgi:hypothetical protein